EVAVGTVIQAMPQINHVSQPRWDRFERAALFEQYRELRTQGLSERQAAKELKVPRTASIMGSATLCFSRWAQRRGGQLHRVQNRRKHRARLLTEKALRCRCPIRPGEEKVVHGSEAFPLTRQIESSKLMATQRQVAVAPLHIGTRALEHGGQPLGLVM